jgi:hypothetical protein
MAKKCIYGDDHKGKMSKEHIFGDWINAYVNTSADKTKHFVSEMHVALDTGHASPVVGKGAFTRDGSPHNQTLRIVCESCNNGWMSRVINAAREPLIRLVSGKWPALGTEEMTDLAAWAEMVTISIEQSHLPTATIGIEERKRLMTDLRAGSHVHVYCSLFRDPLLAPGMFQHFGPDYAASREITEAKLQSTIFLLEGCLFLVISGSALLPNPDEFSSYLGVRQIWPLPAVPPRETSYFKRRGAIRVSRGLWAYIGHKRQEQRHWGPWRYELDPDDFRIKREGGKMNTDLARLLMDAWETEKLLPPVPSGEL